MPALVMRICNDAPAKLSDDYSSETRDLVARLLCKDPTVRPRVHDILDMPFVKARIEQFLDPEAIVAEFSHTVIRQPAFGSDKGAEGGGTGAPSSSSRPRTAAGGAGAAATGKGRPKTTTGAGAGATKRAPSRGGAGGAGATRAPGGARRPSPGPPEPQEETSAQRAQRQKEDEERRIAMREQIKRDRLAYAKTQKAAPTATEIVEQAVQAQHTAARPAREFAAVHHAPPGEVDDSTRRALEKAYPGTRLLTEDERRASHESLIRRQQEVVARVQSSQLKGEAGRAALNEAQRELLDISRIQNAMSKRYVLLRTGAYAGAAEAMMPGTIIAGVPIEEVGLIDEDDAEIEDDVEEEIEDDVEDAGSALAATLRVGSASGGQSASGFERTVRVGAAPADMRSSLRWDCGSLQGMPATEASSTMDGSDGGRRHGGIKFDVTLESGSKALKPPARQALDGRREPAQEAGTAGLAGASGDASTTLSVPAQLFGVGRPLASKVDKLRAHLEDKLGSRQAFERVYDYVSREEKSEQQSGEREEILAFMADQRDLLPLVHTLLYLEEALDVRK
uniref:non-specific serine/threonine protein kinase n=1 Tax=Haptolina brevifila TaxID=156173 RepID=A0A7S2GBD7_9EUKA|mmetsp:Transcript_31503/g.62943  ORF Transcript_31503/g.62943 Transcript_31503/m.62943 type:complete len:565 (+) Transcript_31503:835-2529(+)